MERAVELVRKAANEGPQQIEWMARKKNGDVFWLSILLKKIRMGHADYVIATGRDITLEKQIRLALDESNQARIPNKPGFNKYQPAVGWTVRRGK